MKNRAIKRSSQRYWERGDEIEREAMKTRWNKQKKREAILVHGERRDRLSVSDRTALCPQTKPLMGSILSLVKSKWRMNSDLSERNKEAISFFSVYQDHLSLFLFVSPCLHRFFLFLFLSPCLHSLSLNTSGTNVWLHDSSLDCKFFFFLLPFLCIVVSLVFLFRERKC